MRIIPISYKEAAKQKNIFFGLFQNEPVTKLPLFSYLPDSHQRAVRTLAKQEFRGEFGETKSVWFPAGSINRIRLFGWGEKSRWNERKDHLVPRRYVQYAKSERISEFTASYPLLKSDFNRVEASKIFAINALLANFEYVKYKETPKAGWPEVKTVLLAVPDQNLAEAKQEIAAGIIVGEETNAARELANTPGSDMTPEKLAAAAVAAGKRTGVKVKILDEPEIKKIGMGGVLGVARGSDEKPKFIILEYFNGPKTQKPLVLAGKGVTFDSGGIHLKPDQYMQDMHMDMSGGAAVIHGIAALARLKIPVSIVGLVPAVENMPSGSSYRPGDLLKSLSGKTIEVLNTDAEGRIILADALTYALRFKPRLIVDFATLTGAAHVALGNYCSAIFTNRDLLIDSLIAIGQKSGDYVWPLPLWDEYLADIKGTFGDVANIATKQDRYGGAIHGAKFLEQFVNDTPWAHIDIAPRMTSIDSEYLAKGATGVGVRYIVELGKEYPNLITNF